MILRLLRLTVDPSNEPKGYYTILFIYDKSPSTDNARNVASSSAGGWNVGR